MGMTDTEKKMAFLLSTSPYLDVLDGSYDKAAKDLIANGIAPVRHGRWMRNYNDGVFVCSCCHNAEDSRGKYCSYCGARMDGTE